MSRAIDGVNVIGYLRNESGVGNIARGYVNVLRSMGVPLALTDVSHLSNNRSEDFSIKDVDQSRPFSVNLICLNADELSMLTSEIGTEFLRHAYNIGVWFWELPRFPDEWHNRFKFFDEIWCSSSFIANTLAPIAPIPVIRVPPKLTLDHVGSEERGRTLIRASDDECIFLFVFNFRSYFERKNPLALVRAFKQFLQRVERPQARLVIKCVNPEFDPEAFTTLQHASDGDPVDLISDYWSAEDMHDLLAGCDAFVSLHRSEGLGLGLAEAIALGKPAIATDWSGNTDFMDIATSFPVRYRLVELDHDVGPYRAGNTWAEPCVEHASEMMRLVYSDQGMAREIGQAGKRLIESEFSTARVSHVIDVRLQAVSERDLRVASARPGPARMPSPASHVPEVPAMDLDSSLYGMPGRIAKRVMSLLLSYHTRYQREVNESFSRFMRELQTAQADQAQEIDRLARELARTQTVLRAHEQLLDRMEDEHTGSS